MRRRHGLTLIEVLTATAMLSAIAAVAIPILGDARRALTPDVAPSVADLSRFADLAIADRGPVDVASVGAHFDVDLPWDAVPWEDPPVFAGLPSVAVTCRTSSGADERGGWLQFSCAGRSVYRWVAHLATDAPANGGAP